MQRSKTKHEMQKMKIQVLEAIPPRVYPDQANGISMSGTCVAVHNCVHCTVYRYACIYTHMHVHDCQT